MPEPPLPPLPPARGVLLLSPPPPPPPLANSPPETKIQDIVTEDGDLEDVFVQLTKN